jgi:tetratricopeptide (TPR) repeat protein
MKRHVLIAFLLVSCITFMGLKLRLDNISKEKVPGSSIIYLPSGKYLKYATLGYTSIAADLIYLWAIQYYSDTEIKDRYDHLEHIFSIIFEMDPYYLDPYEIGAVIAVYEAENVGAALRILDKGIENNPDQWLFPFEAGHYAQRNLNDYQTAQHYYKQAMDIDGAPPQARRLFANAAFEILDYETALKTWFEIYQTATDERTQKIASNHLYRVRAAIDIRAIKEALAKYRDRYGHYPLELDQLVPNGYLQAVPSDMDNKKYIYDPKTGEVKPPIIPWKR